MLDATANSRGVQAALGRAVVVDRLRLQTPPTLRAVVVDAAQQKRRKEAGAASVMRALKAAEAELVRVHGARGEAPVAVVVMPQAVERVAVGAGPLAPAAGAWAELITYLERLGFTVQTAHWWGRGVRGSNRFEGAAVLVTVDTPYSQGVAVLEEERALARLLGETPPAHLDDCGAAWRARALAATTQAHGRARSLVNGLPTLHVSIGRVHCSWVRIASEQRGWRAPVRQVALTAKLAELDAVHPATDEQRLGRDQRTIRSRVKALGWRAFKVKREGPGRPEVWFAPSQEALDTELKARGLVGDMKPSTPGMNLGHVGYKDSLYDMPRPPRVDGRRG